MKVLTFNKLVEIAATVHLYVNTFIAVTKP